MTPGVCCAGSVGSCKSMVAVSADSTGLRQGAPAAECLVRYPEGRMAGPITPSGLSQSAPGVARSTARLERLRREGRVCRS
ncbi:hypothetical protein C791_5449 [Amycolatopsis azurea DSM 43854]|uniref:Uncharacterized protein n=1 Tax=Amycolatopsis azurea DSM 43854 TaxID=1238180 RepID=M2QFT7_9PSEU|nr:hypothetical protein C791_5449 [Amycolatopsis azurea DSM 43854]